MTDWLSSSDVFRPKKKALRPEFSNPDNYEEIDLVLGQNSAAIPRVKLIVIFR